MDITNLITSENNETILTVLTIAKQDIAIKNAVNALNELNHINKISFESHGKSYGISEDITADIYNLMRKLEKANFNKF